MQHMIIGSLLLLLSAGNISAQNAHANDSSRLLTEKRFKFRTTARLNSRGLFNFSGRICTDNPAFDISIVYDRKHWGVTTVSVVDLQDIHSDNNFSLTLLYKRIRVGKRLTITPHTGYIIGDWGRERGDRQILITAVRLSSQFNIDHTMLLPNVFGKTDHDWTNRIRMLYTADAHLDFIFSIWHNNRVFDHAEYFSTALNTAYNRIKVSDHLQLNTGITFLVMTETNDEELFPKKNGLVFTIAAVVN